MRKFAAALMLILVLASKAFALGHVASEYDYMTRKWTWEMGLSKDLLPWLEIGATERTQLMGYGMKIVVPSGIPELQSYDLYAELKVGATRIRLTDWCNHYLSQSGVSNIHDSEGLRLTVRMDF